MIRGLPKRSTSRPVIGDSANMPKVCADSTIPTVASPWPWSVRCSGVMVMIRTMTTWPAARVTRATSTDGERSIAPTEAGSVPTGWAARAEGSASSYGSGRRKMNTITQARLTKPSVSR